MNTKAITTAKTTGYTQCEWHIVPDVVKPNCFNLETTTGNIVCSLAFPEHDNNANITLLNLVVSAPELQDIAEMYHDTMLGNKAEKTMVFSIVSEVLDRVK